MTETVKGYAPFAYDDEYYRYMSPEKAEQNKFVTLMTQRNAKYRKPAEVVYNSQCLDEGELMRQTFAFNLEAPTPQIMEIDGYDPEDENNEEEGNCNPEVTPGSDEPNNEEPVSEEPTQEP